MAEYMINLQGICMGRTSRIHISILGGVTAEDWTIASESLSVNKNGKTNETEKTQHRADDLLPITVPEPVLVPAGWYGFSFA